MADTAEQLVQSFKMAVHNLQVLNASRGQSPITESEPCALEVLLVLERILRHDLKPVKMFTQTTPWDFLQKVSDCIPNGTNIMKKVKGMSSSGIGRARVFLRFGFNNGCLDEYLKALLWNQKLTTTYYGPDSVLLDEDKANVFLSLLDLLREVKFALSLQERGLEAANYWEVYVRQRDLEQARLQRRQSQRSLLAGTPSPGGAATGKRSKKRSGRVRDIAGPGGGGAAAAGLQEALREAQEANVDLRVEMEKAQMANETLRMRERAANDSVAEMEKTVEVYRKYMLLVAPGRSLEQMEDDVRQAEADTNGEDAGPAPDEDWDAALLSLGELLDKGTAMVAAVKAADSKAGARLQHAGRRNRSRSTKRPEHVAEAHPPHA
mmetsp:Transcript_18904/g.72856  ORF Transcript_18904/g.72856 Transcript_18904/m.72856 type:complete len:379 (-) Transcript_18904:35-1171(-)